MTTTELVCKCGAIYTKTRSRDKNLCPTCKKQYFADWRAKNPDRCRKYAKDGKATAMARNPEKVREKARDQARKRRALVTAGKGTLREVLGLLIRRAEHNVSCRKRKVAVIGLTVDDLIEVWHAQGGKCAISGMEMLQNRKHLKSVSMDRKDSTGAYTKGNVQLVCRWANLAKGSHTDGEIMAVLAELRA